jgi:hypothetical protein
MINEICTKLEEKKKELFALCTLCGKREDSIAQELYLALDPWNFKNVKYDGLFGWEEFRSDKFVQLENGRAIIEVKKVIEKSEYGYWHGLIQCLLYRFQENANRDTDNVLFICIILDWGRKLGQRLDEKEMQFLSQYKSQQIYFIRISMIGQPFIEHNLGKDWTVINS